jgi:hypothetical protein
LSSHRSDKGEIILKMRFRGVASVASRLGRAIFGQSVLGHSLAYLLALLSLIVGMAIGLNVSQPLAISEPTRSLIDAIDTSEKILATAPGYPSNISDKLDSFRKEILGIDTLKQLEAPQQRSKLNLYKSTLINELGEVKEAIKKENEDYARNILKSIYSLQIIKERSKKRN